MKRIKEIENCLGNYVLYIACLSVVLLSGCGHVTKYDAITSEDIKAKNPLDGSFVYPLHTVVMGNGKICSKFIEPLNILERRMNSTSYSQKVISSADCGILACYANDMQLAQSALDRAIVMSKSASVDSADIHSITSLSGTESNKVFKGEPHEEATMRIFRGLLYLADNDPENAKSCFIQTALIDATAEDKKNRSNWLCADVLATLSFKLYDNEERANDYLSMISKNYDLEQKDLGWVSCDAIRKIRKENMTIIIVATGLPPIKSGQGILEYTDSSSMVGSISITHNNTSKTVWMTDNVYVQACTRGRRQMDNILQEKDSHQKGVESVGSVAIAGAVAVSGPVGLAVQLIAGAVLDKNKSIDIDADNRFLSAVPGRFYLWVTNSIEPGENITIQLNNTQEMLIAKGTLSVPENGNGPNIILAWFPY
ncbi:MAG: hypothetical protein KAQ89_05400 [Planctomycetes bacterium]|nr:hypothetical protein [Planctomycetota bacterium]